MSRRRSPSPPDFPPIGMTPDVAYQIADQIASLPDIHAVEVREGYPTKCGAYVVAVNDPRQGWIIVTSPEVATRYFAMHDRPPREAEP